MTHEEIFTQFCKPEFEEVKSTQQDIIGVLKGRNGGPGLCERVRNLERTYKAMIGAVIFAGGAVVIEIVSLIFRHFAK